jgi:hypothetical protein
MLQNRKKEELLAFATKVQFFARHKILEQHLIFKDSKQVLLLQNSSNLNLVWLCLRRNRYASSITLQLEKLIQKINKKCPLVIPGFDV